MFSNKNDEIKMQFALDSQHDITASLLVWIHLFTFSKKERYLPLVKIIFRMPKINMKQKEVWKPNLNMHIFWFFQRGMMIGNMGYLY